MSHIQIQSALYSLDCMLIEMDNVLMWWLVTPEIYAESTNSKHYRFGYQCMIISPVCCRLPAMDPGWSLLCTSIWPTTEWRPFCNSVLEGLLIWASLQDNLVQESEEHTDIRIMLLPRAADGFIWHDVHVTLLSTEVQRFCRSTAFFMKIDKSKLWIRKFNTISNVFASEILFQMEFVFKLLSSNCWKY